MDEPASTYEWTRRRFLGAVPLWLLVLRTSARAAPPPFAYGANSLLDREVAREYLHEVWEQVILRWAELGTAKARARAFTTAINKTLRSVGVADGVDPVVTRIPKPLLARFNTMFWKLLMDLDALSAKELSETEALSLVALLYHEARHAEQAYLIARTLAGQGRKTAEAILKRYVIDRGAAASAAQHPLRSRARRAQQAEEWFKDIAQNAKHPPVEELVKAQAALDQAQARLAALEQAPRASDNKRQKAQDFFADARVRFERARARYNAQLIEGDARLAHDLIVSIWQEERRP